MPLHLERDDYVAVAGVFLAAMAVGTLFVLLRFGPLVENVFRWVTSAIILVGIVAIYRSRRGDRWGGQVARSLELIGIGFGVIVIEWVPHIGWHMQGAVQAAQGGNPLPAWLGLPGIWWLGFFHALVAGGFALAVYGLYQFWRAAETLHVPASEPEEE